VIPNPVPAVPARVLPVLDRLLRRSLLRDRRPNERVLVPDELVVAARSVRDQLVAGGSPITRRSLAAGLRAAGHRIRNDRLGSVLAAVDGEGGEARPLAGSAAVRGGRVGGQHAGV
jgi:hypothetical protein